MRSRLAHYPIHRPERADELCANRPRCYRDDHELYALRQTDASCHHHPGIGDVCARASQGVVSCRVGERWCQTSLQVVSYAVELFFIIVSLYSGHQPVTPRFYCRHWAKVTLNANRFPCLCAQCQKILRSPAKHGLSSRCAVHHSLVYC